MVYIVKGFGEINEACVEGFSLLFECLCDCIDDKNSISCSPVFPKFKLSLIQYTIDFSPLRNPVL